MYENGKMRPVETIPGMGGGGIKENDGGVNSTMMYYYKNFGECHNVSPCSNNMIIENFSFLLNIRQSFVKIFRMLNYDTFYLCFLLIY
jgi:hypothetical protein